MITLPTMLVFSLCAIVAAFGVYILALFAKGSAPTARAIGVVGLTLFVLEAYQLVRSLF